MDPQTPADASSHIMDATRTQNTYCTRSNHVVPGTHDQAYVHGTMPISSRSIDSNFRPSNARGRVRAQHDHNSYQEHLLARCNDVVPRTPDRAYVPDTSANSIYNIKQQIRTLKCPWTHPGVSMNNDRTRLRLAILHPPHPYFIPKIHIKHAE